MTTTTSTWTADSHNQFKQEQLLEQRALLFDRIMTIPESFGFFRNALLALWYPCFNSEAIDLALRQLTVLQLGSEDQ